MYWLWSWIIFPPSDVIETETKQLGLFWTITNSEKYCTGRGVRGGGGVTQYAPSSKQQQQCLILHAQISRVGEEMKTSVVPSWRWRARRWLRCVNVITWESLWREMSLSYYTLIIPKLIQWLANHKQYITLHLLHTDKLRGTHTHTHTLKGEIERKQRAKNHLDRHTHWNTCTQTLIPPGCRPTDIYSLSLTHTHVSLESSRAR